jgi:DNA-binding transcriptional ArsR family regulator
VRDLAISAALSDATLRKALKRLTGAGLIKRDKSRRRQPTHAGTLVLLSSGVSKLPHSSSSDSPPLGGLEECDSVCTHPAFAYGRLSKAAGVLLVELLRLARKVSRPEWARAVGRKSRNIRPPLDKLVRHGIVHCEDGLYDLAEDWRQALDRAAENTGAVAAQARQQEAHRLERAAYKQRLEAKVATGARAIRTVAPV